MARKIMPQEYFIVFLIFSVSTGWSSPLSDYGFSAYNLLGLLFVAFGAVMNLWTDSIFKKRKTTVKPYGKPDTLIDEGPFSISRNPMYLGMASMLLGIPMLMGSYLSLIYPIIFVMVMERRFIPYEERNLKKTFGKDYDDYRNSVRRWI